MKKVILTLMCMAAMMAANMSLMAQEVTIVLNPGWTWISYPSTDTMDFATAFGSFTPATGDIFKSRWGSATYTSDGQWRGSISQLYPGYGYHYKSNRAEPVIVTFNAQQPAPQVVVTTSEPTDITAASAIVGGTVTLDESNHIYACGVCWDTVQMPTVNNNRTTDNTGISIFSTTLTELTPNTTYYVRAYVVTDYGLAYGDELSFTTESSGNGGAPIGAINSLFTINENGDQVYFSQGNLQYQPSTNTWRFAENQSDLLIAPEDMTSYQSSTGYYADVTSQYTSSYDGWIDLFGWGTSGWNNGNTYYQPWSSAGYEESNYGQLYGPPGNYNLTSNYAYADWGVYNPISNGGNTANQWRTLTQSEWNFVFKTRNTTSGIRYAKANVNNVNGIILLPDDWNTNTYTLNNTNSSSTSFSNNTISASQWTILESAGAIFLPTAGNRIGTSVNYVGSGGIYWSTSYVNSNYACSIYFYDSTFGTDGYSVRYYGHNVRLVKDYNP